MLAIGLGIGISTGSLQRWVQARVVAFYVARVAPHLPFVIESADVDAGWRDFFAGKISRLALVVRWDQFRAELSGPITLKRATDRALELEFATTASLEQLGRKLSRSSPFLLTLGARISPSLTTLQEANLLVQAEQFDWKVQGLSARNLYFGIDWRDEKIEAEANAGELSWTAPDNPNQAILLAEPRARIELGLTADGALRDSPVKIDWGGKSAEILWNEIYLDLPLEAVPVSARIWATARARKIEARLGAARQLEVSIAENDRDPLRLEWKTRPALAIAPVLEGMIRATSSSGGAFTQLAKLSAYRARSGKLTTTGALSVDLAQLRKPESAGAASAPAPTSSGLTGIKVEKLSAAISNLDLDIPSLKLALRGLNARFAGPEAGVGEVSIRKIQLRKAEAQLGPTPLRFEQLASQRWVFRMGEGMLPFQSARFPLSLGAIEVWSGENHPLIRTRATLAPTPVLDLAQDFCVSSKQIPPATLHAEFPKIELTSSWLDPQGTIRIDLFGGRIETSQLAIYDFDSPVPETNFDVSFNGIRLDQAGQWSGFGKMDGLLTGYAKGVVFQAWLPTNYDFRFEAQPQNYGSVVFSAQAMENLVRLIASEQLDAMPSYARWFSFGWPSRFFGGYNVDFVGLTLLSSDGTILLGTLDPPELFEKERKHFILYGPRFRMPLNSERYPVVLDAAGMGSFVRNISKSIETMMLQKQREAEEAGKGKSNANPTRAKSPKSEDEDSRPDPLCDPTAL